MKKNDPTHATMAKVVAKFFIFNLKITKNWMVFMRLKIFPDVPLSCDDKNPTSKFEISMQNEENFLNFL